MAAQELMASQNTITQDESIPVSFHRRVGAALWWRSSIGSVIPLCLHFHYRRFCLQLLWDTNRPHLWDLQCTKKVLQLRGPANPSLCLCLFQDICKALWCHRVGRKCETKFMPAAEGSACGPDMVTKHMFSPLRRISLAKCSEADKTSDLAVIYSPSEEAPCLACLFSVQKLDFNGMERHEPRPNLCERF